MGTIHAQAGSNGLPIDHHAWGTHGGGTRENVKWVGRARTCRMGGYSNKNIISYIIYCTYSYQVKAILLNFINCPYKTFYYPPGKNEVCDSKIIIRMWKVLQMEVSFFNPTEHLPIRTWACCFPTETDSFMFLPDVMMWVEKRTVALRKLLLPFFLALAMTSAACRLITLVI